MKRTCSFIIVAGLLFFKLSSIQAGEWIDYAGIEVAKGEIKIDGLGASNVDSEAVVYKLVIGTQLLDTLAIEYGLVSLGDYGATYDITAGTFNFHENHRLDFSRAGYLSARLQSDLSRILGGSGDDFAASVFIYANMGAILWQADLDMQGSMYDGSVLYANYGATSNDSGLSGYYSAGIAIEVMDQFYIRIEKELYQGIGKGSVLHHQDGTSSIYNGRDVEVSGISLLYYF